MNAYKYKNEPLHSQINRHLYIEPITDGGGGDASKPPAFPLPLPDGDGDDAISKYYSGDEVILWFE